MLTDSQKELLRDRVCDLLWAVGIRIEHETIEAELARLGCSSSPAGRMRIPRAVIEEFVASQRKTEASDRETERFLANFGIIDWGNFLLWSGRREQEEARLRQGVRTSVFDCGPTRYYDYPTGRVLPVDTEIFMTMKKWAQTVPEIGYTSTWYRQDVPPETERIESLVLGLKTTDKLGGIEAIYPEHIKYLQAIGEIVTGRPNETAYICGSQCMTPPLILDRRSAAEAVERAARKIRRFHVASMMAVGVNTPITIAGAMTMMAAEILGGMVAVFSLDPEADITGRMIASIIDMRNAQVTCAPSECMMINIGVKELFDAHFGRHMRVDDFFSTVAKRPGLQAVIECFAGAQRFARLRGLSGIGYPGVGTLDNGGVGSPTQAVLDIEIRKALFMAPSIAVDDESIPFAEICQRVQEEKDFLSSDHTLDHFRELHYSPIFRTDDPTAGAWAGDEKAMLEKCDEMWRESLKSYVPPQWPDDALKALDQVAADARKELLRV